jgi:hypothetical protein
MVFWSPTINRFVQTGRLLGSEEIVQDFTYYLCCIDQCCRIFLKISKVGNFLEKPKYHLNFYIKQSILNVVLKVLNIYVAYLCQVVVRHPVPLHLTPCSHCYSTARYHTNISPVKHFGHGSFNRRRISRNLRRHHFTVAPQRPSRPVVLRGLAPLKNVLQGGSHRRHVGVLRTHRMYVLSLKQTDTLSQSLCQMS